MQPRRGRAFPHVETIADVPRPGPYSAAAREHEQFDFKQTAAPSVEEHAKDIAAFANGFGGVLIYGARLKDGELSHDGISTAHAMTLAESIEKAATQYCVPTPRLETLPLALPTGLVLLAVNVEPSLDLVGARVDRGTDAAWRFPVRAASQTDHITPGDVRMFIDAATRRAHLMLEAIPQDRRATTIIFRPTRADRVTWHPETDPLPAVFNGVTGNVATFHIKGYVLNVPLRDVLNVWPTASTGQQWCILLDGSIHVGEDASGGYRPRVR